MARSVLWGFTKMGLLLRSSGCRTPAVYKLTCPSRDYARDGPYFELLNYFEISKEATHERMFSRDRRCRLNSSFKWQGSPNRLQTTGSNLATICSSFERAEVIAVFTRLPVARFVLWGSTKRSVL